MPAGRPSTLTQEHKEIIVDMLALGDSVGKISKHIDKKPSQIFRWIDADEELSDLYARAKEAKAQLLSEEVIEIADDDNLKPDDKRVRIDARKWVAGKYYGKLFGDKQQVELSGKLDYSNMSDDEIDRAVSEAMSRLEKAGRD